uniref:Amyloid beta A4 precursor protein-binding family B member 1-interacting protein n=1 Tax=Neogobius melanostomus TaxID=47308 RepID=A0A8C6T3B0_9GOBI
MVSPLVAPIQARGQFSVLHPQTHSRELKFRDRAIVYHPNLESPKLKLDADLVCVCKTIKCHCFLPHNREQSSCLFAESLDDLDGNVGDIFVADPSTQPEEDVHTEGHTAPLGPPAAPPLPSSTSVCAADHVTQTLDREAENLPPAPKLTMLQTMIVKVLMADGSSKTLMVEGTQTVRDVLDKLFEKTYCDCGTDWSLCETNPELSIERILEDHEYLVESVSAWTNSTENKIYFLQRPRKHVIFKQPQFFYMWKKSCLKVVTEQEKQLLLKENFEGLSVVVPDLEGFLYLKDDGRKVWKPRYFVLRASGLYYVPKGKTRSSSDLACFIRFEQVNVYWTDSYRLKYRAPTDHCFVLKHPCIQKESHYVKFLCCEDEDSALLWVNSIRIAKYGTALYENYKSAVKRALNPPISQPTVQVLQLSVPLLCHLNHNQK